MPNNLTWRRCANCGQLTLVPASANVCWQCGAPCPDHDREPRAEAGGPGLSGGIPGAGPGLPFAFAGGAVNQIGPSAAASNLPPAKPRFMDLSPADDLIAKRLLTSVFPDGFEG